MVFVGSSFFSLGSAPDPVNLPTDPQPRLCVPSPYGMGKLAAGSNHDKNLNCKSKLLQKRGVVDVGGGGRVL